MKKGNFVAAFSHSIYGWRVARSTEAVNSGIKVHIDGNERKLVMSGRFMDLPRIGQFCKHPHRLLAS